MEGIRRPELYKWQRITSNARKPRTPVKAEAVTDDIEQWIKKVEQASDFAAAQAFGKARTDKSTKASILQTVDQLHDHDAAYEEAQELLQDWVHGQLHNVEDNTIEAEIWSEEEDFTSSNFQPAVQNIIQQVDADALSMDEYDRLMNLENYNEDLATQKILDELMKKEVVRPEFLHDLGDIGGKPTLSKPKKDPSIKMRIRQTQVKETREKRRLELNKKREQEAFRKETLSKAKQDAAEVRRVAAVKAKQEEIEIQKEMSRIKKELQEDRKEQLRKQEEERELERRISQVSKAQAKSKRQIADSPVISTVSEGGVSHATTSDTERKSKLAWATQVAEARYIAHNLRLLKKYFNSWFDNVLERRMQLGKARAVADWKCLFRSWNAWRHFSRERTLERLKIQHENSMLDDHRKLHQGSAHYDRKLLKRCFLQWHIWATQERQAKESASDQNSVREKMSAFLAAGRRLAHEQRGAEQKTPVADRLTMSRVDEMFDQSTSGRHPRSNHKSPSARNKRLPTEAWQVTRRHLKLSSKQISDLTDTPQDKSPEVDAFEEATSDAPHSPRVPKTFQHRFQAQQKLLQEQQKALREQKQMIENLQFKQDRSLLEQQVKQQQSIQQQLEKLTKLTLQDKKLDAAVPRAARTHVSNNDTEESKVDDPPQTSRSQLSSASKVTSASSAFSRRMEERTHERQKAKQEREEHKRKLEEDRVAEIIAKEDELRQQDAEEKKRRVEAFKEKRRLEKQRELELQQLKEKAVADQRRADEHSRLRVLKFYGFQQLKRHCEVMKRLSADAEKKHALSLQSQVFTLWKLRHETAEVIRNDRADDLHRKHLVRHYFRNWTQWRLQSQILATKADRHYQTRLISDAFRAWLDITTREKIEMWEKERHARQHDTLRLKSWAFSTWRRLPEERRQEIEREKRREEMRRKVANLLPDFAS